MTKEEMLEIRMNSVKGTTTDPLYDCTDCGYNTHRGGGGCGSGLLKYRECGDHSQRGTH